MGYRCGWCEEEFSFVDDRDSHEHLHHKSSVQPDGSTSKRNMTGEDIVLGVWMSSALDDPKVCAEMKTDIDAWFKSFNPLPADF